MKTLIEVATKESKYIWADDVDVVMSNANVVTSDLVIGDLNSTNSTLVENVDVPADWAPGKYIYDNGFAYSQKYQDKVTADDLEKCISNRAAEYPPAADYLDGIVKGDQAQVQAYIDACLAVKAKYPKPS